MHRRLKKIVKHPTLIQDLIKHVNARQRNEVQPLQQRLLTIEKTRKKLADNRRKYIKLFDMDALEDVGLKGDLAQITEQLRALDEEEVAKTILDDFVGQLEKADIDRQRTLLRAIVSEITFKKGKGISSMQLHLHDGISQALGMTNVPSIGSSVLLSA